MRGADVQLLVEAGAIALVIAVLRPRVDHRRTIGVSVVALSVLLVWGLDRLGRASIPRTIVAERPQVLLMVAWGAAAAVGAARLSRRDPSGSALPALCVAAAVGVWAGVPETSYALVALGVIVGLAGATQLRDLVVVPGGAAAIGLLPVGAGLLGAVAIEQAVVGAMLATAPLVLLAFASSRYEPTGRRLALGAGLALGGGLVAARLVGVERTWSGTVPAIVACAVLAVAVVVAYTVPSSE